LKSLSQTPPKGGFLGNRGQITCLCRPYRVTKDVVLPFHRPEVRDFKQPKNGGNPAVQRMKNLGGSEKKKKAVARVWSAAARSAEGEYGMARASHGAKQSTQDKVSRGCKKKEKPPSSVRERRTDTNRASVKGKGKKGRWLCYNGLQLAADLCCS